MNNRSNQVLLAVITLALLAKAYVILIA
jgi:hypothetical protein